MKKITKHYKKLSLIYITTTAVAIIVSLFFIPSYMKFEHTGNNIYTVYLNEKNVGTIGDLTLLDECLRKARLGVAKEHEEMVLVESDVRTEGKAVMFGLVDSDKKIEQNMRAVLDESLKHTLNRSYTMKINEYTVNLATSEEVQQLLQACISKYDEASDFEVSLILNPDRELNVLTASIERKEEEVEPELFRQAGIEKEFTDMLCDVESTGEKDFSDFDLGLKDLQYGETVEVVEAYLLDEELTPLDVAIEQVTKDQEKEQIYEVVAGDTLSVIAQKNNITIEKLIEMNDTIENEFSTIRIDDELIVTVPEPELSVVRQEEKYFEEDYDAPIEYVYNDNWFTNQQVTLQEPSAGHRNVVANLTYRNDSLVTSEILKEEVVMEAVPKIVEKGTKIPPTYIKPLSGGRLTSQFGRRSAPKRGASSYHKGVDWATPTGTAVVASCSGTVARAGWGSGYGYVVYINHPDGKQTRYGHLSKVLVKQGQYVEQGQKIALSGNTGVSTGPHVHFEILVGGSQVNPFKYLN